MREILFRAKRMDNKGWVEGLLTIMWGQYHIIKPSDENTAYLIDPETVCQYTGLTDKKGRKIFEGDIVKASQYGVDDGNGHNYAGFDTFSVEFSDGGFCLKNKWRRFNLRPLGNFEIIGNIFDNPELIGDQP